MLQKGESSRFPMQSMEKVVKMLSSIFSENYFSILAKDTKGKRRIMGEM